jgi:hypothetical protein
MLLLIPTLYANEFLDIKTPLEPVPVPHEVPLTVSEPVLVVTLESLMEMP